MLYQAALPRGRPTALLTDERLLQIAANTIRHFEQGDPRAKANHNFTSNDVRGMCNVVLALADRCDKPSAGDFRVPRARTSAHTSGDAPEPAPSEDLSSLMQHLIFQCVDRLAVCLNALFECPTNFEADTTIPLDAGKKAATSIKQFCAVNRTLASYLVTDARHMYMQGNAMYKADPWAKLAKRC
jgi:hypothetical protein